MGMALYEVVGQNGGWQVKHDGQSGMSYATKEAAFEAACASASIAIREGHDVQVTVSGSGTTTGAT